MNYFNPLSCHNEILESLTGEMAFCKTDDFWEWRIRIKEKLKQLLGNMPEMIDPKIRIEYEKNTDSYKEIRYVFSSEAFCDVPCHLLIPKGGKTPYPVVICLQGHSTGMHISLGRAKYSGDKKTIAGDRDFALQAVREGYAALTIEQRGFGERLDDKSSMKDSSLSRCHQTAMGALLLGRTAIGERVWDVSRAIDTLTSFREIDSDRIGCMGNSGGGTITFFASCMDERIKVSMPSCYVCLMSYSLMPLRHCSCNYIPGILKYFDISDLAGLIAPRPLIVVAGEKDNIFPIEGVKKAYKVIEEIYEAAGTVGQCRLVVGDGGHQFYAEQGWSAFGELSQWK